MKKWATVASLANDAEGAAASPSGCAEDGALAGEDVERRRRQGEWGVDE